MPGDSVEEEENVLLDDCMLDPQTAPQEHRAMQGSLPVSMLLPNTTQGSYM